MVSGGGELLVKKMKKRATIGERVEGSTREANVIADRKTLRTSLIRLIGAEAGIRHSISWRHEQWPS